MATTTETGGPAFPGLHPSKECHYQDAGMSLRDYFAAKAMQGICAHSGGASPVWAENNSDIAEVSYELADAMLKARGA